MQGTAHNVVEIKGNVRCHPRFWGLHTGRTLKSRLCGRQQGVVGTVAN